MDLVPGESDDLDQETLRQAMLAHHPGRQLGAGLGQNQVPVGLVEFDQAGNVIQTISLAADSSDPAGAGDLSNQHDA